MEQNPEYRRNMVRRIRPEVEPLFRYIDWFESKVDRQVSSIYSDNELSKHSVTFPVYDATLLSFIKDVQKTNLTDRNYVYVYTRHKMNTPQEEKAKIEEVGITDMEILTGVLSKYVLGGMTKGYVWPQAVRDGIFLAILKKYRTLLEVWDQPEVNQ